jgi:hypothetical protein
MVALKRYRVVSLVRTLFKTNRNAAVLVLLQDNFEEQLVR